jgi:hypothetical protein
LKIASKLRRTDNNHTLAVSAKTFALYALIAPNELQQRDRKTLSSGLPPTLTAVFLSTFSRLSHQTKASALSQLRFQSEACLQPVRHQQNVQSTKPRFAYRKVSIVTIAAVEFQRQATTAQVDIVRVRFGRRLPGNGAVEEERKDVVEELHCMYGVSRLMMTAKDS